MWPASHDTEPWLPVLRRETDTIECSNRIEPLVKLSYTLQGRGALNSRTSVTMSLVSFENLRNLEKGRWRPR